MPESFNIAFLSTAHIHTRAFLENLAATDDGRRAHTIWDDVPDRGRRYAGDSGARFVEDLDAVLEDPGIHGFVICAENTRHRPLLEKAIPTGKPVFCEKPLVTDPADLATLSKLLETHPTPVISGYFQPFSAEMQAASELVGEGAFGTVTRARFRNAHHAAYARWFDNPDLAWFHDPALSGGGAFMDMGTHAVHLLRTFFGPVSKVWAMIGNEAGVYPEVDDFGTAHLLFESGVRATVEAAWTQTGGIGGLEITGSEKSLWHNGTHYVVGKPGERPEALVPSRERPTRIDRLIALVRGEISEAEWRADLKACMDAVSIMTAAYRSSESGSWVTVDG